MGQLFLSLRQTRSHTLPKALSSIDYAATGYTETRLTTEKKD